MSFVYRLEGNCDYDYIEVFDGPYHSSPLVARLCHGAGDSFTSSSNFMSVRFVSDGSVTRRGFQADYYSSPSNHSTSKSPGSSGVGHPREPSAPQPFCGGGTGTWSSPGGSPRLDLVLNGNGGCGSWDSSCPETRSRERTDQ